MSTIHRSRRRVGVNALFLIPDQVGGSEIFLRNCLSALRLRTDSPDLVIFTNRENDETFGEFERIRIDVNAESRWKRIVAEQALLPAQVQKAGVDLLYSPGYTAPLRCAVPQVVAILDTQFRSVPEGFGPLSRAAQGFLVGGAGRAARLVTTLSEFSKGELRDHLNIPETRIRVTRPGVDEIFFNAPGHRPFEQPYILSVSNTYPHKNYGRLVGAFAKIADRIPHRLVIVGQPRDGEPPPHPRVDRIHRMPLDELAAAMKSCDLFVFPSRYEGFGLPVAEAMAAGAPIAAARAAAIPEVAGEHATYFDPTSEDEMASAMLALLNESPTEREAKSAAAQDFARQYTWPHCAESTLAAFQEALGEW